MESLPSIAMSLGQFKAFLKEVARHFEDMSEFAVRIAIRNGIETHQYTSIDELSPDDAALPDVIQYVTCAMEGRKGESRALHRVEMSFARTGSLYRNRYSVSGPGAPWVQAVRHTIRARCWSRAPIAAYIRPRWIAGALAVLMFGGITVFLEVLVRLQKAHYAYCGWLFAAYLVSAVLFAVMGLSDRVYYGAFPLTTITVRDGPRRIPYETFMFLLAILGLVAAIVPLFGAPRP